MNAITQPQAAALAAIQRRTAIATEALADIQAIGREPYDVEAGRERIRANRRLELSRNNRLSDAYKILREDIRNEGDVVRAICQITAGAKATKPLAGSDMLDTIAKLNAVSDEIEFRYEP